MNDSPFSRTLRKKGSILGEVQQTVEIGVAPSPKSPTLRSPGLGLASSDRRWAQESIEPILSSLEFRQDRLYVSHSSLQTLETLKGYFVPAHRKLGVGSWQRGELKIHVWYQK